MRNLRPAFSFVLVDILFKRPICLTDTPYMHRRTYRFHGSINPCISGPCHTEVILLEKKAIVSNIKKEEVTNKKKTSFQKRLY